MDSLGSAAGEGTRLWLLSDLGSLLSDFASIGETTVRTSHAKKRKKWKFWNCCLLARKLMKGISNEWNARLKPSYITKYFLRENASESGC